MCTFYCFKIYHFFKKGVIQAQASKMQWLPGRKPGAWAKIVRPREGAHGWPALCSATWLASVLLSFNVRGAPEGYQEHGWNLLAGQDLWQALIKPPCNC